MPMIKVDMFPGRTQNQKRALVRELTRVFVETCGGPEDGVKIMLTEVEKSMWASGGVMVEDVNKD